MIFLGLLPLTILVSLNCCIYWAVRRARIERQGRTQRKEEERKPRRNFIREAVKRYRGVPTTEIELRELAPQQDLGQVRFLLTNGNYFSFHFCMHWSLILQEISRPEDSGRKDKKRIIRSKSVLKLSKKDK